MNQQSVPNARFARYCNAFSAAHLLFFFGGLIAIHSHPLRVAAELPVGRGADGTASSTVAASGTALLQSQQLLSTESLVVDLASGLNKILEVSAGEEVPQVDEFAMVLVLDVDHTPTVLATANLLAVNNNGFLATHHGEGDDVLEEVRSGPWREGS